MIRSTAWIIGLLLSLCSSQAQYFLKLDGIKGEVTTAPFKDEIAINSLQFGMGVTISNRVGGGSGSVSAPFFSELTISKSLDRSSIPLLLACAQGSSINNAVLSAVESSNGTNRTYYQIELENIIVTSVSQTGSGDRPTESVAINFSGIRWKYFLGTNNTPIITGWNRINNQPLP